MGLATSGAPPLGDYRQRIGGLIPRAGRERLEVLQRAPDPTDRPGFSHVRHVVIYDYTCQAQAARAVESVQNNRRFAI
jgi:hypothetical protein